ncbi:putative nucleolar protein 5, partial [Toxoplasma gondii VAND]
SVAIDSEAVSCTLRAEEANERQVVRRLDRRRPRKEAQTFRRGGRGRGREAAEEGQEREREL